MNLEKSFGPLRPYCSALMAKPNSKILAKLSEEISKTDLPAIKEMQEYVMLPFQMYLRNPVMPENYTIEVLLFIKQFYGKVELSSPFVLRDVITSLLMMTGSKSLDEDLKVAVCNAIIALLDAIPEADVEGVLDKVVLAPDFKLQLSHLVFQTLEWAESEENAKDVIISSVTVVRKLGQCVEFGSRKAHDQFSGMLPGISTKLIKTLRAHQNQKITIEALKTWTLFVCMTMKDQEEGRHFSDGQWFVKAQNHLLEQFQLIANSYAHHSNVKVRLEVLNVCQELVTHCKSTFHAITITMIEALACLSVDIECESLALQSETCLDQVLALNVETMESVVENVQGMIFQISTELSQVSLSNSKELGSRLRKLLGYVNLLQKIETSSLFFYSSTYVGRLLDGLLHVAKLDKSILLGTNFLHDFSSFDFVFKPELHLKLTRLEKNFVYLTTEDLKHLFKRIVKVLTSTSKLSLITDHLNERFEDSLDHSCSRHEVIYLINSIISGRLQKMHLTYSC